MQEIDTCSYIVLNGICSNCIRENRGTIKCLEEGCALVKDSVEMG